MSSVQQLFPTGSFGSVSSTNAVVTGAETVGSLVLPTTGGTATPLTYYEEYSDPAFVWSINGTGYQTTSVTSQVKAVRVGSLVTVRLVQATVLGSGSGTAGIFISTSTLPARFCPAAANVVAVVTTVRNSGSIQGSVQGNYLGSTGVLSVSVNFGGTYGTTLNANYGFSQDIHFSWLVI